MASVESSKMLAVAAEACDEKKAEDIRILALDPSESGLTDFFLICTGSNDRQTVAITDEIEIRLKREFGTYPNSVEGRRQGEWILMDYVDFIVHVFLPEKRAYYGLERLRPSATTLSIEDLNAEIRAAIAAKRPRKTTSREAAVELEGDGDTAAENAPVSARRAAKSAPANKKVTVKSPAKRATAALKRAAKKVASKAFTRGPVKATAAKRTLATKAASPKTSAAKKTATKASKKRSA